jgi:hypothetical protein
MTARSRALRRGLHPKHPLQITMRTPKEPAFKFELLPLHSPLLRQSRLVSFPPLIDMLKFSGYPYLIRGQPGKKQVANKCVGGRRPGLRSGRRSPIRSRTGRGAAAAFRARPPGAGGRGPNTQAGLEGSNDARTGMPPGIPGGAMCVQRLDDSLNSAIHISYRISLRSSSMPEPRDPLLKVLTDCKESHSDCKLSEQGSCWGLRRARARGRVAPRRPATLAGPPKQQGTIVTGGRLGHKDPHSVMILPQVHLRKPCYDFYFL